MDGISRMVQKIAQKERMIGYLDCEGKVERAIAEIEDFREETFHRTDTDYEAYAAVQYCLDILKKYMDGEK